MSDNCYKPKKVDAIPSKNGGERVSAFLGKSGATDHTCDDPPESPFTSEGRLDTSDHLGPPSGVGQSSGCDRMNGKNPEVQRTCGIDPRPRGRTPRPCPVCGRPIAQMVTRVCAFCGKEIRVLRCGSRGDAKKNFCTREHRTEYERIHGRNKVASWPRVKRENLTEYADAIFAWRTSRNMKQIDFARVAGVPQRSVSRIENAEGCFSLENYRRVGNLTGVW